MFARCGLIGSLSNSIFVFLIMVKNKIEHLAEELAAKNHKHFIGEAGKSINVYEKATGQTISVSSENDFMLILTNGLLTNPYLVVGQDNEGILTVSWPKGVVCQTDDIGDVLNIFYSNRTYIHHIYEDLEFPFFFLKIGMLFSPQLYNSLRENPTKNIYDYSISQLTNDIHKERLGLTSSRTMDFGVQAAFLRENPWAETSNRESILKKSALELDFETIRKEKYNWAPSRLSSFYLMSDSEDNRWNLRGMFGKPNRKSIVVELKTTHLMSMIKVDYRWVEAYDTEKDPDFIENYWSSKPFVSGSQTWEYLYEGALEPINPEQIEFFKERPSKI